MDSENLKPPVKLLPGERLDSVEEVTANPPDHLPSSMRSMLRLARSPSMDKMGEFGPVVASLSLETHQDQPEFHRYEVIFGRDSLRVALDLVDYYPKLTRSTLLTLATLQGVKTDLPSEEQPGRIVHEVRDPSVDWRARELTKTRGWGWPYYGSVDATPEFIRTLAAYCNRTKEGSAILKQDYIGRDRAEHSIADALEAALGWIEKRLQANAEGLLEYKQAFPGGIENQVWRDSPDSYFHADGSLANNQGGIASLDVQRVTYDALLDAADLLEAHLDQKTRAAILRKQADHLCQQIMEIFWTENDDGYFVLGTDRDEHGKLRQLKVKTSDMGHVLHSRLLDGDEPEVVQRREAIIRQLFSSKMLGLNGIRSVADDEARYRPGAYHNGSVWIWENYLISQGLAQHGYYQLAAEVNRRLLDDINATRRFPEYLRGDNDPKQRLNTRTIKLWDSVNDFENKLEQPPQDIQAWSAAAILSIKLRYLKAPTVAIDAEKRKFEKAILRAVEPDLTSL